MSFTERQAGSRNRTATEITLRELLSDRSFALYLVGQTTSRAGSALASIALVFAVLSVSRSPSSVGLVLLASRLPGIALTLAGGVIADRWSRQRIAICMDAVRAALQAVTGVLLIAAHVTVVLIVVLQLLAGAASAMFNPAAGALAATVAPRGQIRRAGSLLGITAAVAQTGGLALSGFIVAIAGPGASLMIDSATFAISSLTFVLISAQPTAGSQRASALDQVRDGWREVAKRNWLITYTIHETVLNVLALSPFFVLGPVIAEEHLGGAPAWSAIALGYVLGNLAAAHITYHWAPRRPVLAALLVSIGLAPMLVLLGAGAPIWLIVPAALLAGAQSTIYNTLITSTLQSNLPREMLGRATAIAGLGSTILVPIGMGLAGLAANAVGAPTVLIASGGIVLALTAGCLVSPVTRRPLRLDLTG